MAPPQRPPPPGKPAQVTQTSQEAGQAPVSASGACASHGNPSAPEPLSIVNRDFNALSDHLERIALEVADRKPSRTPDIDARFLVIAADALRQLGEQMIQIASLGHELRASSDSANPQPSEE